MSEKDQSNPAGLSPEILAWVMGLGPDPFAMYEDDNSQVIGNWDLPADPDEIGTFDFQNDRLTAQNKANDQYSDFAQIAQLGTGAGGPSPEMFEPLVTWEPVQAPGFQQMQYYKNSGDPIMAQVAKRFEAGATASQIMAEVQALIESGDPEYEGAVFRDPETGLPDWKSIQTRIYDLEKNIISDPAFDGFDPDTSLPARRKVEQTAMAKWFSDRGLPNPHETYSPDLLADPATLKRERENVPFTLNRTNRDAEAMLAKMLEQERTAASKMVKERSSQRRSLNRTAASDLPEMPGSLAGFAGASYQQHPRVDRSSGRLKLKQPSSAAPAGTQPRDSTAFGKTYVAQMQAKQAAEDARFAQLERERMMAALTRQGRTPFNDVNRPRQGNVYGF